MVQITWMDRRGAGYLAQTNNITELDKRIRRLFKDRLEATARDESGEVVGGVERTPKSWVWWYDNSCLPHGDARRAGSITGR